MYYIILNILISQMFLKMGIFIFFTFYFIKKVLITINNGKNWINILIIAFHVIISNKTYFGVNYQ